jgi:hypothetical protein
MNHSSLGAGPQQALRAGHRVPLYRSWLDLVCVAFFVPLAVWVVIGVSTGMLERYNTLAGKLIWAIGLVLVALLVAARALRSGIQFTATSLHLWNLFGRQTIITFQEIEGASLYWAYCYTKLGRFTLWHCYLCLPTPDQPHTRRWRRVYTGTERMAGSISREITGRCNLTRFDPPAGSRWTRTANVLLWHQQNDASALPDKPLFFG